MSIREGSRATINPARVNVSNDVGRSYLGFAVIKNKPSPDLFLITVEPISCDKLNALDG